MKVTEAKLVSIIYNNSIYIGDIHTTFNYVSANQHIIFPVHKIKNGFFEPVAFHLPVRISYAKVRAKSL